LSITDVSDLTAFDMTKLDMVARKAHEPMQPQALSVEKRAASAVQVRAESGVDLRSATLERKEATRYGSLQHGFDELKINFLARHDGTVKSVLFVATSRGAGTTTAALNFARSLAQDVDARVLLIKADLREADYSTEKTGPELTNLISPEGFRQLPAQQGNLHIVPCGRGYADPTVLFQSKRFRAFMAQCHSHYDYIIVDGPPLDEAPESIALVTNVDGVVLVLDARNTRRRIALRAKERIEQVGGKILGVALNRRRFYIPGWLYRLIC
jgi:capsular exopolysaccharide synthesis family protein